MAAPPWRKGILSLWEEARTWEGWPHDAPVMPPAEALAYLDAAEEFHARHGFYVLPEWRGLHIPPKCPAGVSLDLQACFLASCYGAGPVEYGRVAA